MILHYQKGFFYCLSENNHIVNEKFSLTKWIVPFQKRQLVLFPKRNVSDFFYSVEKTYLLIMCKFYSNNDLKLCTQTWIIWVNSSFIKNHIYKKRAKQSLSVFEHKIWFVCLISVSTTTRAAWESNSLSYSQRRDWSRLQLWLSHWGTSLTETAGNT